MSGNKRGRVKEYRLISCKTSGDKQTIVHYADPKFRTNLRPLCRVANWALQVWEIDPVEGLGAQICGRCIRSHEYRMEQEKKQVNARQLRLYRRDKTKYLARMTRYRAETQRQRKVYRQTHRQEHAAWMRQYRQRLREQRSLTTGKEL